MKYLERLFGLTLAATPVWAGVAERSAWMVVPLAVAFAAVYLVAKAHLWRYLWGLDAAPAFALSAALALVSQAAVTAALFFAGRLLAGPDGVEGFGATDVWILLVAILSGALFLTFRRAPDVEVEHHDDSPLPSPYAPMLDEAALLGRGKPAAPERVFELARRFAEAPRPETTLGVLEATLFDDGNMNARRVAYTTLRLIGQSDFESVDVPARVRRGLEDPSAWVRHDAVWAGETLGMSDAEFRQKLADLAGGAAASEDADLPSDDADGRARARAARLLRRLRDCAA